MLSAVVDGLTALMTPQAILFMVVGVVYGIAVGIVPGLGGIVAMALLLPFIYGHEPAATLALLIGCHIATIWGSSVTSILFNVPGSAKSLALTFDGYPMTQQGHASRALGASATAALLGGVIGAVFLAISIPIVRPVMLALGPSEYLVMALWGLTVIATFSEGSLLKGLIATALGVSLAFVGMDPVTATPRYTFGSLFLLDGISFPVAMIGMFAIGEMIKLYVRGGAIITRDVGQLNSTTMDGVRDVFQHKWLVFRSSLLGLWIGVLPGIGASVGGIAAYAQAVQTSRTPEKFGTGTVEGVIAPDATLGANEGGGLLPTLALGIPGGESMAILLIAFVALGIVPGPQMLTEHLDIVFSLVWIIVIASALTTAIGLALSGYLARLPGLNPKLIIPLVMSISLVGAYATRGQMGDVFVAGIFGVLGYFMIKYNYSRANLVIGMVLAGMIERTLHLSISNYGDYFIFKRPVALTMLIIMIVTTALPFIRSARKRRALNGKLSTDGAAS